MNRAVLWMAHRGRLGVARNERLRAASVLVAVGLAAGVLVALDPATSLFFPPCPLRALSGLECPGCGSTRAMHQLLNGNLGAALGLNPLLLLYLPVLGYATLSSLLVAMDWGRLPRVFVRPVWIWLLLAGLISFWVVRNTPLYPMLNRASPLAPSLNDEGATR